MTIIKIIFVRCLYILVTANRFHVTVYIISSNQSLGDNEHSSDCIITHNIHRIQIITAASVLWVFVFVCFCLCSISCVRRFLCIWIVHSFLIAPSVFSSVYQNNKLIVNTMSTTHVRQSATPDKKDEKKRWTPRACST